MDKLATNYWLHLVRLHPPMLSSQDIVKSHREGWQLSIPTLYEHLQDETTQMWWVRHGVLNAEARSEVDWDATRAVMTSNPANEGWYITKAASSNCGVGTTQVVWGSPTDADCPRCGQTKDTTHVLRCRGQGAKEVWTTSMAALLSKYLSDTHTAPVLQDTLDTCLNKWRENQTLYFLQFHPSMFTISLPNKKDRMETDDRRLSRISMATVPTSLLHREQVPEV
jgi:hypothetical protein